MQEEVEDQMDTVEAYEMINGMCEDERVKRVKHIWGECQDARYLPLEEEKVMRYTKLQQNHCMFNRGKSTLCIVNSNKACISTELTI